MFSIANYFTVSELLVVEEQGFFKERDYYVENGFIKSKRKETQA